MESALIESLPGFEKRMKWFIANRPDLCQNLAPLMRHGVERAPSVEPGRRGRAPRVLEKLLDETEFLSPHGIRSVSKYHEAHPYVLQVDGHEYRVSYEPAESRTGLFGGNSNWRGPVWFPINYLLIESLQRFHFYFGEEFKVEFPTGSGQRMHLGEVAAQLSRRLSRLFLRDDKAGARCSAETKSSRPIRTFATILCSTNISTATTARAWAPAIRPAGPRWSPSCCNRAASKEGQAFAYDLPLADLSVSRTVTTVTTIAIRRRRIPLFLDGVSVTASTTEQKRRSLLMIVVFTLLSAAAQVLLKFGTIQLKLHPRFTAS